MKKKLIILLILILAISSGIILYSYSNKKSSTPIDQTNIESADAKILQLEILTGMVYRHLIAYNLVCQEAGVELKKYPDYFSEKYKTGIQKIDSELKKENSTLEIKLQHFDPLIYKQISEDIKKELFDLERIAVKHIIAHRDNIPLEQVEWTKEREAKLNLADACSLFDEKAEFFLNNSAFDKYFMDRIDDFK